jgi:hypothetical protein
MAQPFLKKIGGAITINTDIPIFKAKGDEE